MTPESQVLEVEREETPTPRALRAVPGASVDDLDLEQVNSYIQHLNWPVRVETLKADLESALPFLERRGLVRNGEVTQLGLLVAGPQPEAYLGARGKLRLETPSETVDFAGSLIPALEASLTGLLRAVRVPPSAAEQAAAPVFIPDEALRQALHNAIAHRDYAVNRPTAIRVNEAGEVTFTHPGRFPASLLVEAHAPQSPLLGLLPAVEPANPWLTEVLHVFRKWDGRRIGMSTLLQLCLGEQLRVPTFLFARGEVRLTLQPGTLLDPDMEARLQTCDAFIEGRNGGQPLPREQQLVLAYLMNAAWAHAGGRHTLLLTVEQAAAAELNALARAGLVVPHPLGSAERPFFVPHPALLQREDRPALEAKLGPVVHELSDANREILAEVHRQETLSRSQAATATRTAASLWCEHRASTPEAEEAEVFQAHIRHAFNRLKRAGFLTRAPRGRGYAINTRYGSGRLF